MERCFIISKGCKLHNDYMAYIEGTKKNNEIIKKFFEENGIEAKSYSLKSNSLAIIPTESDLNKFKQKFKKVPSATTDGNTLYEFKKNSVIGKAYIELKLKVLHKPMVGFYLGELFLRMRSRLFMYENVLYASVEAEGLRSDMDMPDGWEEIKRSEFYKVVEKLEEQ